MAFNTAPHDKSPVAMALIVGTVVSITNALTIDKEPGSPGSDRVKVASLPAESLIVAELRAREFDAE